MTLPAVLIASLAACSAVDIWLEIWLNSGLFATRRAILEASEGWLGRKLNKLASCRFCLSFHATWIGLLLHYIAGPPVEPMVAVFAISKVARLASSLHDALAGIAGRSDH